MTTKNARFWMWHKESFVKLTLKPNQKIVIYEGGKTDEGYSESVTEFEYDVDTMSIIRNSSSRGRDCDGGYGYYQTDYCKIDELQYTEEGCYEFDNVMEYRPSLPNWTKEHAHQYDEQAELAGY